MALIHTSKQTKPTRRKTTPVNQTQEDSCSCACMYCGKVRVAPREWKHQAPATGSQLSHSACPDCYRIQIASIFDEIHAFYGVAIPK